ncbi:alpha/beta hydrolase [Endozoicomonadaceae bacterium StTr2]
MKRLLILCLFAVGLGIFIFSSQPEGERFQPAKRAFPEPQQDFQAYIAEVRSYLEEVRVDPTPEVKQLGVDLNSPVQVFPPEGVTTRGRFLLIHGLGDSAYSWRDMAFSLAQQGFETRTILLPGHGSRPGDMLRVSAQQWLEAARQHFAFMRGDNQLPLYVGGFSTGGLLATQLALENPDIAGLLLVAPAWQVEDQDLLKLTPWVEYIRPWSEVSEDLGLTRYRSYATHSYAAFYNLQQKLMADWGDKKLAMPTVVIATKEDSTVDSKAIQQLFEERFVSPDRQLIWYDADQKEAESSRYMQDWPGADPVLHILSQSHISLINSPVNKLFGRHGNTRFCKGRDEASQQQCMANQQVWYGAWEMESPDQTVIARTTYNPRYERQLEVIIKTLTAGGTAQ